MNLDLTPFNQIAEDLVKAYQRQLETDDHISSGKLRDTLTYYAKDETGKKQPHSVYHVEWNGNHFILELQMQHYWKCLEEGTKPHMPPVSAMLNWIKLKKIMPREPSKLPMEKQLNSLAWAMAYKIKQQGTKAHSPLGIVLESEHVVDRVKAEIVSQLKVEMEQLVVTTITGVKGVGSTGYQNYKGK